MNKSLLANSIFIALVALCFQPITTVAQQGPTIVPDEPASQIEQVEQAEQAEQIKQTEKVEQIEPAQSTQAETARPFHSILDPTGSPGVERSSIEPNNVEPNTVVGELALVEPEVMDAGEKIDQLLTQLVLKNMPHDFTEDKDWGKQSERWDGLKVQRDGFKIKTKRRKKMVNHGTWKKYSAKLINPNEEFSISVRNMRQSENGNMGFDVHFGANLDIDGRQSKWVKGVQLYSLGVDGHAKVRLMVEMEMAVSMDVTQFPPDLIFKPRAKSADIVVDEFRIDHVGKAGGEIAQQITRGVRKKLDQKVAEKKAKLVSKINKELDEQKDKLRLSIVDAVKSKWAEPAKKFLPESVQSAMGNPKAK